MTRAALMLSLVLPLLTTACASSPHARAGASASADCEQLSVALRAAQEDKRTAVETRDGAWKVVIPVAVVGRYAVGSSQVGAADRRLGELGNLAATNGCAQ
jgi:hypothetical protein